MLAVTHGYAELALLRADAPPLLRDDLAEIHQAASRSAQITQQLLTFARKQIVSPQVLTSTPRWRIRSACYGG